MSLVQLGLAYYCVNFVLRVKCSLAGFGLGSNSQFSGKLGVAIWRNRMSMFDWYTQFKILN